VTFQQQKALALENYRAAIVSTVGVKGFTQQFMLSKPPKRWKHNFYMSLITALSFLTAIRKQEVTAHTGDDAGCM